MDVVANYAAGEEAVGAFFSCEGRKDKQPAGEDEPPRRGLKKNRRSRKCDSSSRRTSTTTSSPPRSGRSLEAHQMEVSSIRC